MARRPKPAERPTLVLNPRGTIFQIHEGARQHLVPFVMAAGGTQSRDRIEASYHQACVRELDADQFWQRVGLEPAIEDAYLATIPLRDGIHEFLERAADRFAAIACFGKEIGRWSGKLRERHGIDRWIGVWSMSGDAAHDRLEPEFRLEKQLGARVYDMVFVDSHWRGLMIPKALSAAVRLFDPPPAFDPTRPDESVAYPRLDHLEGLLTGKWVARPDEVQFMDARARWTQVLD